MCPIFSVLIYQAEISLKLLSVFTLCDRVIVDMCKESGVDSPNDCISIHKTGIISDQVCLGGGDDVDGGGPADAEDACEWVHDYAAVT